MTFPRSQRRLVAMLILSGLVVGCKQNVDLSAVRSLSQAVRTAQPSYAAIAADLYQSCVRQHDWNFTGNFMLRAMNPTAMPMQALNVKLPPVQQQAPKAKTSSLKQAVAEKVSAAQSQAVRTENQSGIEPQECTVLETPSRRWQAENNILTSFFVQLGAAAGDDSRVDFGFSKLADAVPTGGGFTADQKKAAADAASSLARAIFAARRQNLVATQATAAAAGVDTLVGDLQKVAELYKKELDLERGTINSFFARNFVAQDVGLQTLETLRFRGDWTAALSDVQTKVAAADAYEASLQDLDDGTKVIVDKAAENDFASVDAAITAIITELQPDFAALQKAFA